MLRPKFWGWRDRHPHIPGSDGPALYSYPERTLAQCFLRLLTYCLVTVGLSGIAFEKQKLSRMSLILQIFVNRQCAAEVFKMVYFKYEVFKLKIRILVDWPDRSILIDSNKVMLS